LKIQHLRRVVQILKVLLFTGKKNFIKQADLSDMIKKASKSACTSTVVVMPDPLALTPSTSSAMETPENTEEDPDDCEPADGDIQMEYSSD
jgi:hypothetical protein